MSRRKAFAAAVGLLVALGAAACGSSTPNSGGDGGSQASNAAYQVGFDSSLSGPYAANGVGQREGFMAYVDYVNKHGGVDGHPVDVTALDDAGDISTGTANETQLIAEHDVSVTVGWLVSNICGAASTIAVEQKVPIICSAIADNLLDPAKPYVYSSRISQTDEALPDLTFAKTLLHEAKPKVAIIVYGSAASTGLQGALENLVERDGWPLVANVNVPLTATDISAQTAQVIAAHPDVIVGSLYDPLAVEFMRSLQAKSLDVPFIDYDGASLQGSLLPLKDPNYYIVSSTTLTGAGSQPGLVLYRTATKAAGVNPVGPFVNVGYAQAMEVVSALKACGYPCSGADMQRALNKLDVNTGGVTSGPLKNTSADHEPLDEVSIYHWDTSAGAVVAAATNLQGGNLRNGGL